MSPRIDIWNDFTPAALIAATFAALGEGAVAAILALQTGADPSRATVAFLAALAAVTSILGPAALLVAWIASSHSSRALGHRIAVGLTGNRGNETVALMVVILVFGLAVSIATAMGMVLSNTMTPRFAAVGEALFLVGAVMVLLIAAAPLGHFAASLSRQRFGDRQLPGAALALFTAALAFFVAAVTVLPWPFVPLPAAVALGLSFSELPYVKRALKPRISSRLGRLVVALVYVASVLTLCFQDALPRDPERSFASSAPFSATLLSIGRLFTHQL